VASPSWLAGKRFVVQLDLGSGTTVRLAVTALDESTALARAGKLLARKLPASDILGAKVMKEDEARVIESKPRTQEEEKAKP